MPFKIRDSSPERRRTSLKKDRSSPKTERSEKKDRERTTHRKSSGKDRITSRTSESPSRGKRRSSMPGSTDSQSKANETQASDSKASLPYPSFSKAHSKELVGSRETLRPNLDIFTPPATDVNASKEKIANPRTMIREPPPSPPLTDQNIDTPRGSSSKPPEVEAILEEDGTQTREKSNHARNSDSSSPSGRNRSQSEIRPAKVTVRPKPRRNSPPPLILAEQKHQTTARAVSQPSVSFQASSASETEPATRVSSNATSIAPGEPNIQRPGPNLPPAASRNLVPQVVSFREPSPQPKPPLEIFVQDDRYPAGTPGHFQAPPPPPPPPPIIPLNAPKVDYLLQHGGLSQVVPKTFMLAGKPMVVQQAVQSPGQSPTVVANLFEPYNALLDDFEKVVSKNGSLAVATGYRSVARRLLDRLEAVFARDISSEVCHCCVCSQKSPENEDSRSVSWGEILELVSGRRDLPNWPPFSFVQSQDGLGISLEAITPMQELDADIPEEYREHYIKQSRKTKQNVDKWLHRQHVGATSLPEDADDETLTFAILTHLPPEQRPTLTSLLGIVQTPIGPPRRAPSPEREGKPQTPAPTPQPRNRSKAIESASLAIQRLYRLGQPPRDAETAFFMLNNPTLHNALATLAEISNDEWDILTSGRFDGFLRSGAEDLTGTDLSPSSRSQPYKSFSRGATPAYGRMTNGGHSRQSSFPSRGTTPANVPPHHGAPVAFDEDTEIATLAEIERDIYIGMEALEDAFEALHQKAETVRMTLRERNAGLAAAAQRRRGSAYGPEVRGGTPASLNGFVNGENNRWDAETDDGLGDWEGVSELAPDDSASNISTSRRRRPKRRHERRTPVAVLEEEEDGEYADSDGTASPKKR